MPNLIYVAPAGSDRLRDRVLAHPERILAAWWGTAGTLLTSALLFGDREMTGSLRHFPGPLLLVLVAALALSGLLIAFVTFLPSDSRAWALERLGWVLGIGAWIAYGAGLVAFATPGAVAWSLPAAMVLLCVVRLTALGRSEVAIRRRTGRV